MLDHFLQAAYGTQKIAAAQQELTQSLEQLPTERLLAIAHGTEKIAYSDCSPAGSGECSWLDRFKGTPLFQKAFQIEQSDLQMRMEEQAVRAEEDAHRDHRYSERSLRRDALGVQRKMLELELAALEEGMPTGGGEEAVDPNADAPHGEQPIGGGEGPQAPGPKEAAARFRFAVAQQKIAADKAAGLMGAAAGGLLNSAKAALPGVGKSLAQAGQRTMGAFQRGGVGAGLRTAGRSALSFAGQHPVAAGAMGAGAAGLGAGFLAGRASD